MGIFSFLSNKNKNEDKDKDEAEKAQVTLSDEEIQTITKDCPHFRYFSGAYKANTASFEYKTDTCDCCGKEVKLYHAWTNDNDEEKHICPQCIASGDAHAKLGYCNDAFDVISLDGSDEPADQSELNFRTPVIYTWNTQVQLVHCGDYCDFLGFYKHIADLKEYNVDELIADYEKRNPGISTYLDENGEISADASYMLFHCNKCNKYFIEIDLG